MSERGPQPEQPPQPGARPTAGSPSPQEREGQLVLERRRKDDGRALIAYWHGTD